MQVGNVRLVGQAFTFNGCSCSKDRKPRQRKTKEERRAMVESFITKYRSSNNGNFPSLNLTHKEVGGSFYIVREIVRDIIQENKILGPGSLNLQSLSFDDSADPSSYLSRSSTEHETDNINVEIVLMDDQSQCEESSGLGISDSQLRNAIASQVLFDTSSHVYLASFLKNVNQHRNLPDSVDRNLGLSSGRSHANSGPYKLCNTKIHGSLESSKNDHTFPHSPSDPYQTKRMVQNHKNLENSTNNVVDGGTLVGEKNDLSETNGTGALQERVNFEVSTTNDNRSSQLEDDSNLPLVCSVTETCNSHISTFEAKSPCNSNEVLEVQDPINEFELLMPVHEESLMEGLDSTDVLSSRSADEELGKQLPSVSQCLVSHESGILKTKEMSEVQSKDIGNITKESSSEFDKSVPSTSKEEFGATKVTQNEHTHHCTTTVTSRENTTEAQQRTESNPFWATVKSFVAAVIKFWTE